MSMTPIPVWMKNEVLERDGWACLACGVSTRRYPGRSRSDSLSFDHVVPEALGGMTTVENLQVLCLECNVAKGCDVIDYRDHAENRRRAAELLELEATAAAEAAAGSALDDVRAQLAAWAEKVSA